MKKMYLKEIFTVVVISAVVSGCATFGKADSRWADYKTWTKITEGRTSTGDPTGFIGTVHAGPTGYRDIFVNKTGLATNQGTAPYNYPVGSVLVKEQYANKAAWEAQKSPELTTMVKVATSATPNANNWAFAAGYKGTAEANAFCSGCHTIAQKTDFVFTNEDFFKAE
jgi:hypothetical protein